MRGWWLALGLVACGVEGEDVAGVGPPPLVRLSWSGNATHGGQIQLDAAVAAAIPNGVDVWFVTSDGGVGPGACPPALQGACLGIAGTPRVLGSARVRAGHATRSVQIPLRLGPEAWFQAIVLAGGPALSDPLTVPITGGPLQAGDTCQNAPYACSTGLACCYPCGIPGCTNTCTPACAAGSPGCFGGCYLFP